MYTIGSANRCAPAVRSLKVRPQHKKRLRRRHGRSAVMASTFICGLRLYEPRGLPFLSLRCRTERDPMDKIGFLLSHEPSISTENFRSAQLSRWTKHSNFASRIDSRDFVTELTKPPRRSSVLPCYGPRSSPRACSVEQSWNNVHAKSLCFPALSRKHCSIDLRVFLARGPREQSHLRLAATVFKLGSLT